MVKLRYWITKYIFFVFLLNESEISKCPIWNNLQCYSVSRLVGQVSWAHGRYAPQLQLLIDDDGCDNVNNVGGLLRNFNSEFQIKRLFALALPG